MSSLMGNPSLLAGKATKYVTFDQCWKSEFLCLLVFFLCNCNSKQVTYSTSQFAVLNRFSKSFLALTCYYIFSNAATVTACRC